MNARLCMLSSFATVNPAPLKVLVPFVHRCNRVHLNARRAFLCVSFIANTSSQCTDPAENSFRLHPLQ